MNSIYSILMPKLNAMIYMGYIELHLFYICTFLGKFQAFNSQIRQEHHYCLVCASV